MSTNHDGPRPDPHGIASAGFPQANFSGTAYQGMKAPRLGDLGSAHATPKVVETASSNVPGYESLYGVFGAAYDQAARGKGQERHARQGEGFENQPIFDMARRFGVGSLLAQAFKKMDESQRLGHQSSQRELLGAIVYIAAAYIHNENQQNNSIHGN